MAKVIIVAGQSNAQGGEWYDLASGGQDVPYTRTKIFRHAPYGNTSMTGSFVALDAVAGTNNYSGTAAQLGGWDLELATQLEAAYPAEEFYFIKVAWGGKALTPLAANNLWYLDQGLRKTFFEDHLPSALNILVRDGITPEVVMVWDQGESDTAHASVYGTHLAQLIADVRKAIRIPNLPFIVNGLAPKPGQAGFTALRVQQEAVAAADSNAYLNNVDTHPKLSPNDSHFTTDGYKMTGVALFNLISTLTLPTYTPVTPEDIHADNGNGYIYLAGEDLADGAVSEWPNRFTHKPVNPKQATGARQPVASGGVVSFDATDDGLTTTTALPPSTYNYHFFFKLDPVTGNGCLMELNNSVSGHRVLLHLKYSTDQKLSYYTDANGWQGVVLTPAQDAAVQAGGVFEYVFKGGVGKVLLNGETLFTGTYTARQAADQISVGSRYALANFYNGAMSDVVVFRSGGVPLTDTEAAAIRAYLFYKP